MEIKPYMGKEQRAYIKAMAIYNQAASNLAAELPSPPESASPSVLEAYAETHAALFEKHGVYLAYNAMFDARWDLLQWAKGVLAGDLAGEPELPEVLSTFSRASENRALLEDLVGQCLELNPAKAGEEVADEV